MKDLSRHIEYLLCEHNSVAIPGIGLFVAEEFPAKYYIEENIYLPPVRSVKLDTSLTQDDGKLENCLIQLHRITRIVAKKWISEYCENINQSLMDLGYMDMGTIGRLIYAEGRISFESCEAGVNTPELYGLDSFHMPKLPAYAHKRQIAKDPTHFTIRLRRTTVHRVMTAAAMIIVILTVIVPNYRSFTHSGMNAKIASVESLFNIFNNNPMPISQPDRSITSEKEIVNKETAPYSTSTTEIKEDTHKIQKVVSDSASSQALAIQEQSAQEIEQENTQEQQTQTISNAIATAETNFVETYTQEISNNQIAAHEVSSTMKNTVTTQQEIPTPKEIIKENAQKNTLEVKGYCIVMASAITNKGAEHLINKLEKEGFHNAVKHMDNGMLRVVLIGYTSEEAARAEMAIVRNTDDLYSGSWLKHF